MVGGERGGGVRSILANFIFFVSDLDQFYLFVAGWRGCKVHFDKLYNFVGHLDQLYLFVIGTVQAHGSGGRSILTKFIILLFFLTYFNFSL